MRVWAVERKPGVIPLNIPLSSLRRLWNCSSSVWPTSRKLSSGNSGCKLCPTRNPLGRAARSPTTESPPTKAFRRTASPRILRLDSPRRRRRLRRWRTTCCWRVLAEAWSPPATSPCPRWAKWTSLTWSTWCWNSYSAGSQRWVLRDFLVKVTARSLLEIQRLCNDGFSESECVGCLFILRWGKKVTTRSLYFHVLNCFHTSYDCCEGHSPSFEKRSMKMTFSEMYESLYASVLVFDFAQSGHRWFQTWLLAFSKTVFTCRSH